MFGISLVFVGKADTPYGYILVDHKNKTVFKGGEFISIKELLQFEDAVVRQLHDNYLESRGIVQRINTHRPRTEQPRQSFSVGSNSAISNVMDSQAGSKDANRENEVGRGMNVNDVDDEQSQQAKWRR